MLCQLSYAVRSVRGCDISTLSVIPGSVNLNAFFSLSNISELESSHSSLFLLLISDFDFIQIVLSMN